MIYGQPLLFNKRKWPGYERDTAILVLTPGIPLEWLIAVGNYGSVHKSRLKRFLQAPSADDLNLALQNASSITEDDALAMLRITKRAPVPMYVQLYLQASPMSDVEIGKLLKINAVNIGSWRRTINFDPLTGIRL